MVEYRHDPNTEKSTLMEINGRFWGSFPLASQAGASFGVLTYTTAVGAKEYGLPPIKEKLRCRMVVPELKRLGRILFTPGRIADPNFVRRPIGESLRFVMDFFR